MLTDPVNHFAGYEEVLDHFGTFLTDKEAYRSSLVSHEWRQWIQNASNMWIHLFAAQGWTLVDGMDPYVVYRKHRSMRFDLECLVEGIEAIMGDDDEDN